MSIIPRFSYQYPGQELALSPLCLSSPKIIFNNLSDDKMSVQFELANLSTEQGLTPSLHYLNGAVFFNTDCGQHPAASSFPWCGSRINIKTKYSVVNNKKLQVVI
ncbi:hypothetical protein tinsulaeT_30730 [Thalassotalea insulae]|uniref:Uncharacterized protein n=1 Tax=Thalassotalea insulae TaxID=2056778 RepID=A0ABQ6GUX5_9GAMM|nr:hypothetical protein [Thalassotalea insulae]GLX79733.1 hypothetical protein tinsulaeT_30730 [Thalassotalea insulae]